MAKAATLVNSVLLGMFDFI